MKCMHARAPSQRVLKFFRGRARAPFRPDPTRAPLHLCGRRYNMESARVYIGNLNHEANRQDVEDFFKGYGPIRDIWIARRPPGFAFVEFEHPKDAADACAALSGQDIRGQRVRVEVSTRGFRGPRNPRPDAGDRDRCVPSL